MLVGDFYSYTELQKIKQETQAFPYYRALLKYGMPGGESIIILALIKACHYKIVPISSTSYFLLKDTFTNCNHRLYRREASECATNRIWGVQFGNQTGP